MSTQRGNTARTRSQKHKNRTVFKNNLHDTSGRTKMINTIQVSEVCVRCKEIIEWKIKYKKYKPLTQPKKCVKCDQRNVRQAYHVMCIDCGKKLGVCTKCCQSKDVVVVAASSSQKDQVQLDNEMKQLLESLPERKKRTFLRYMNRKRDGKEDVGESGKEKNGNGDDGDGRREELMEKLNALKVGEENSDDDDFDDFDDF